MKSGLEASLVNDPFGDPGIIVRFLFQKRTLLFDIGDISSLTSADLLKVSQVFVSHTHIDHFIGFDRLLRTVFGREKTLTFIGPENFIKNVEGKLAGFTWNLVDRYDESLTIDVVEVREDKITKVTFRAIEKFKLTDRKEWEFKDGVVFEDDSIRVRATVLEHRVPCLGYSLEENLHVNINKDRLVSMKVIEGPWLNELKQSILEGKPDTFAIEVPIKGEEKAEVQQISLGQLKKDLVEINPGHKIAYVTDSVFNERNRKKIIELVKSADLFFCESPFFADEAERGQERCHLTTQQAGTLAREAGVKQLDIFHFSRRHKDERERFYEEAGNAFKGAMDPNAITANT
ncbi:MAG: ribonuclease Z [Nitrospinota bacterium]